MNDDLDDASMTEEQKSERYEGRNQDVGGDGSKKVLVVDLFGGKIDAMMKSNANVAEHIESCSIEIHKCVRLVTATTERVGTLEKTVEKVTGGLAKLEAKVTSSSTVDVSLAGNLILSKVTAKFDEEWMRRMVEEDKHSIKRYESLNTMVQKLDPDNTALKERKGEHAVSTAAVLLSSGGFSSLGHLLGGEVVVG